MNTSIKLNQELICTISSVLGISPETIWESAGITRSTWYNIMKKPSDISIEQLLGIANGQKIPVRRFFYTEECFIGKKEDYIVETYIECTYNAGALREIVNTRSDATWQRAAETIGMSPTRLRNSLLAITRTPVSRFLDVCSTFGIDPFTVLVDPNPERRKRKNGPVTPSEMASLYKEIQLLSSSVGALTGKYAELHSKYESILEKYDNLLAVHKNVLQQLNERIKGSHTDMAAEADGPP